MVGRYIKFNVKYEKKLVFFETGIVEIGKLFIITLVITTLYQLQYSPAGSRKSGDVNDTFTVMLPSVTNTAPSTGAIVTLYLCSSETFLS